MEPAVMMKAASTGGSLLKRASAKDSELKTAARLLLLDLQTADEAMARALETGSSLPLGAGLELARWPRLEATFARLYSHEEADDWEALTLLVDIRGFLEFKHVGLGEDRRLDMREQGWVWFARASQANLRAELEILATTPWWRRRLFGGPPLSALARSLETRAAPPLPPAVRDAVVQGSVFTPQTHWDAASMAAAVAFILESEGTRQQLAARAAELGARR